MRLGGFYWPTNVLFHLRIVTSTVIVILRDSPRSSSNYMYPLDLHSIADRVAKQRDFKSGLLGNATSSKTMLRLRSAYNFVTRFQFKIVHLELASVCVNTCAVVV